jgi:hypothetical protein
VNTISDEQYGQLRAIARAYAPDLPDPTAAEVMLMLYEVCQVLKLEDNEILNLFGRRVFGFLCHWGDRPLAPAPPFTRGQFAPKPAEGPAAVRPARVWVWPPDAAGPCFGLLVDENGVAYVRGQQERRAPGEQP